VQYHATNSSIALTWAAQDRDPEKFRHANEESTGRHESRKFRSANRGSSGILNTTVHLEYTRIFLKSDFIFTTIGSSGARVGEVQAHQAR
jgi:hypothetical protein